MIFSSQPEAELRSLENSAQIFNALSDIPGEIDDVTCLFKVSCAGRQVGAFLMKASRDGGR